MSDIFEMFMIFCFGCSWPISLHKLYKAKSTEGTSLLFYGFVLVGYLCGIIGKIIKLMDGISTPIYVWFFYILNALMISCGVCLYCHYARKEAAKTIDTPATEGVY